MNISPPNSVWPNGLKRDAEGYSVFYPLGTNKVNVADMTWPTGKKLIGPFIYENKKLVGFLDTKALEGETFDIPYNHVDMMICGNPVTINLEDDCDNFRVILTKATSGPVIRKNETNEVETDYEVFAPEMSSAVGMFSNRKIKSIKLYIPKLTDGTDMFKGCELTSEQIYEILNSIPNGTGENNINLGVIPSDISEEELLAAFAEKGWKVSKIEEEDLSGIVTIRYEDLSDEEKELISLSSSIIDDVCYNSDGNEIGRFDFDRLTTASNINGFQWVEKEETNENGYTYTSIYIEQTTSDNKDAGNLNIKQNLTDFSSDLRSLKNGNWAFSTMMQNEEMDSVSLLRNIKTRLSSLTNGKYMFGLGIKNFFLIQMLRDVPPEMEITPELLVYYISSMMSQIPSEELPLILKMLVEGECALNVESIDYIAKNINDLTKTDITHNDETGEGYIDICAYSDAENSSSVINDLKEIEKIFDKKGWKYKINVVDFNNNVMPFKVLSNYSSTDSFIPNISDDDLALLNSAYRIENNICYNENDEVIGEFDTSSLETLNDFSIITEPVLNHPIIPEKYLSQFSSSPITCGSFIKQSSGTDFGVFLSSEDQIPATLAQLRMGTANLFTNVDYFSSPLTKLTNWNFSKYPWSFRVFESYLPNLREWCSSLYFEYMNKISNNEMPLTILTHFKADMPSLVTQMSAMAFGTLVGAFTPCQLLVSFEGKLSSLKNGISMFMGCVSLNQFKSDLQSLLTGNGMFNSCKLNVESLDNIVDTINDLKDYPEEERTIQIEIVPGVSDSIIEYNIGIIDIKLDFNPSDYNGKYGTWDNLKAAFGAKKWKANFYFPDADSESTTYGLRNRTSNNIYTKLEEVFPKPAKSKKEKMIEIVNNSKLPRRVKKNLLEHYESLSEYPSTEMAMPYHNYTSQDDTRYYRLTHFHDSNVDYSDYNQFGSLEEAVEYYDVKPVFDASKLNLANVLKTN